MSESMIFRFMFSVCVVVYITAYVCECVGVYSTAYVCGNTMTCVQGMCSMYTEKIYKYNDLTDLQFISGNQSIKRNPLGPNL